MRICLFEDRAVANLEPLTLTRPIFDLLCGQTALAAKQRRLLPQTTDLGVLVRPYLAGLTQARSASDGTPGLRVNDLAWLRGGPILLINGRWLPPSRLTLGIDRPCIGLVGDEVAYVVLTAPAAGPLSWETLDECLERWKSQLPRVNAPGKVFRYLWELVQHNGEQIRRDFEAELVTQPARGLWLDAGPALVGSPEWLAIDPSARIDPLVVIDTTRGPVCIERNAIIHAFSRLEGPCHIGASTEIHGAKIRGGTTLGPQCRIGGEVEASIIQGHSNKYHDGFLGHAYVGAWVNLGAGTHNSDLRNDYGEVTVTVQGRPVRSGLTKVGCFLGDHTKTGLGTLLNTGTSVGAFCNLLPAGLSPWAIPSYMTWWNGDIVERSTLGQHLETAGRVMGRRGVTLTDLHTAVYTAVYQMTAGERQRLAGQPEVTPLRRSA